VCPRASRGPAVGLHVAPAAKQSAVRLRLYFPRADPHMSALTPFDFRAWIDEQRELLKPPVCNKQIFPHSEFIIMVVGGPNNRSDYHDDPREEFFYQIEGDMVLRTMHGGARVDLPIRG